MILANPTIFIDLNFYTHKMKIFPQIVPIFPTLKFHKRAMLSLKSIEYATVLHRFLHRQLFKVCWKHVYTI